MVKSKFFCQIYLNLIHILYLPISIRIHHSKVCCMRHKFVVILEVKV